MLENVKEWLKTTGITNIGWALGFIGGLIFDWKILAGVSLGIFICHNFVVIKDLVLKIK